MFRVHVPFQSIRFRFESWWSWWLCANRIILIIFNRSVLFAPNCNAFPFSLCVYLRHSRSLSFSVCSVLSHSSCAIFSSFWFAPEIPCATGWLGWFLFILEIRLFIHSVNERFYVRNFFLFSLFSSTSPHFVNAWDAWSSITRERKRDRKCS